MTKQTASAPKSIGRQLNFAAGLGSAVCNRLLEPHGLSLAQWAVLQCLWRNGDLGVKEIARLTGNAPPAASRIVDRMMTAGLVQRSVDAGDRRAVVVGLTERSEEMRGSQGVFEEVNAVLLEGFSEVEVEALFGLLERVEKNGRGWLEG